MPDYPCCFGNLQPEEAIQVAASLDILSWLARTSKNPPVNLFKWRNIPLQSLYILLQLFCTRNLKGVVRR